MNPKIYHIIWTYLGNYSEKPMRVTGDTPEEAANKIFNFFSKDFKEKGTIYVFESAPTLVIRKGVKE